MEIKVKSKDSTYPTEDKQVGVVPYPAITPIAGAYSLANVTVNQDGVVTAIAAGSPPAATVAADLNAVVKQIGPTTAQIGKASLTNDDGSEATMTLRSAENPILKIELTTPSANINPTVTIRTEEFQTGDIVYIYNMYGDGITERSLLSVTKRGDVTMNGQLRVKASAQIDYDLVTLAQITAGGNITAGSNVQAGNQVIALNGLEVYGAANLHGAATVSSSLTITGNTYATAINGTTAVISGDVYTNKLRNLAGVNTAGHYVNTWPVAPTNGDRVTIDYLRADFIWVVADSEWSQLTVPSFKNSFPTVSSTDNTKCPKFRVFRSDLRLEFYYIGNLLGAVHPSAISDCWLSSSKYIIPMSINANNTSNTFTQVGGIPFTKVFTTTIPNNLGSGTAIYLENFTVSGSTAAPHSLSDFWTARLNRTMESGSTSGTVGSTPIFSGSFVAGDTIITQQTVNRVYNTASNVRQFSIDLEPSNSTVGPLTVSSNVILHTRLCLPI